MIFYIVVKKNQKTLQLLAFFPTFETQKYNQNLRQKMEGYERKEGMENDREEIYSKAVRAGKRTYFFDVKATRNNDYYLTITESKKKFDNDGNQNFEKHKIFLYKEDFEKFSEGLDEIVAYIKAILNGETPVVAPLEEAPKSEFDVDFDQI